MPEHRQQQPGKTPEREPPTPFNLKLRLEEFERGYLQNTLQLVQWDLEESARLLGISRESLQQKILRYHLKLASM